MSAKLFAAGVLPRRAAALGIRGRRSGRLIWFPVVVTESGGHRYIVSMLGAGTNWVRNLTAVHGAALLRHGRLESVQLVEIEPEHRGPVLREFLRRAPGARPHIPVDLDAPEADYDRIAADYPVYRVDPSLRSVPVTG
ncbi:nitroreductase family deazaflavin-dependent oxidoreductase [Nocardia sp. BMG111209]|uniref:nitroreductase family deazaflavin-dependent oxidoreductase n=1 Tax=Nocardia sp. BMG111209 TaxID=1160137 RepID=UPI0018C9DE6D|nr:nitroreductase family deazaflavin-dependent oxidoreductase [Nocardia sp. BMG111209]